MDIYKSTGVVMKTFLLIVILSVGSVLAATKTFIGVGSTKSFINTKETGLSLDSALFAHWTFDGDQVTWTNSGLVANGTISDYTGNATNKLQMTNMTQTTFVGPGKRGQALWFDGVKATTITTESLNFSNITVITICYWMKYQGATTGDLRSTENQAYNSNGNGGAWDLDLVNSSSKLLMTLKGPGASAIHLQTRFAAMPSGWNHYCFTFDNSTAGGTNTCYTNGVVQVKEADPLTTKNLAGNFSVANWTFGSALPTGSFMKGWLDDLRIYTNRITAAQADEIFRSGLTLIGQ